MNQDKKTQVVMLATDRSPIGLREMYSLMKFRDKDYIKTSEWQPQHLYFLSDDEIKEGDIKIGKTYMYDFSDEINKDWFNLRTIKEIEDDRFYIEGTGVGHEISKLRKIISSTDKSLGLPRPSNAFIHKYVEEYNKGNIITEVMVEYEVFHDKQSCFKTMCYKQDMEARDSCVGMCESVKLKTKPDNTIIISAVEETWDDVFNSIADKLDIKSKESILFQTLELLKNNYQVPKKIK